MNCNELREPSRLVEYFRLENELLLQRVFRCFFSLFESKFRSLTLKYCQSRPYTRYREPELATDAFNRGLLSFYQRIKREGFEEKASVETAFLAFALMQLKGLVKDLERRSGRTMAMDPEVAPAGRAAVFEWPSAGQQQDMADRQLEVLRNSLQQLDERSRNLIIWRKLLQLGNEEIAARTGLEPVSVNNEVYRALIRLKKMVREQQNKSE